MVMEGCGVAVVRTENAPPPLLSHRFSAMPARPVTTVAVQIPAGPAFGLLETVAVTTSVLPWTGWAAPTVRRHTSSGTLALVMVPVSTIAVCGKSGDGN